MTLSRIAILLVLILVGVGGWYATTRRGSATKPATVSDELLAANNRGIGLLEQYKYADAEQQFEDILKHAPSWRPARVNLALALLNSQKPEKLDRAVDIFEKLIRENSNDAHAHYSLAIIHLYRNVQAEAYPHFLAVTKIDPNDPHAWYHCSLTHPNGREAPEAKQFLETALKLNPYFNAARYALAMHPHERDDAQSTKLLEEMGLLKSANWELEYQIRYSDMGRYAEAIGHTEPRKATAVGALPLFQPQTTNVTLAPGTSWAKVEKRDGAMLIFDFNEDDKLDVLVLSAMSENGQVRDCLLKNEGNGAFRDVTKDVGLSGASVCGCVGDYDNDGKPDLLLASVNSQRLLRNMGGTFSDMTTKAGWSAQTPMAVSCGWLDIDQDGDLDLVTANGEAGIVIMLNIGEAPPTDGGVPAPLTSKFKKLDSLPKDIASLPATQILFSDIDGDRDIDLVAVTNTSVRAILNDRLLRFRLGDELAKADGGKFGLVIDADRDERSELACGNTLVKLTSAKPESVTLPTRLRQAMVCDFDLDGQHDIFALNSEGKVVLLQNSAGAFTLRSDAIGMPNSEPPNLAAIACVDLDNDCVPDVLLWSETEGLSWRKGISNGNRGLRLKLTGRRDKGESLRTNADGLGCWVSALAGTRQPMLECTTLAAGPAQSRLPIVLGVGPATQAEVVRVRWPDNVPQAELSVATCEKIVIQEKNRKDVSCPVLLTWDGTKFVYITDILGGGSMGEMSADGTFRQPRPEESVAIDSHLLKPKDGHYLIKLAEPMDEAMYLDRVRLAVVDHPKDWRVIPDERFPTSGSPPTQDLLAFRRWHHPLSARDEAGRDVLPLVTARDGRMLDTFRLRSWLGFADDHFVQLDFGQQLADIGSQRVFLVLAGWTDYPYPESIFAAAQAGVSMQSPTLEQQSADGTWQTIADLGFPAGLPKWMTFEVTGKLNGRPLRIRSNCKFIGTKSPSRHCMTSSQKRHHGVK